MDEEARSWASVEDIETASWCSGGNESGSSELLYDGSQFEATEKKYCDILSEVRQMRKCLSPPADEDNAAAAAAAAAAGKSRGDDDNKPGGGDQLLFALDDFMDPYVEHAMKKMRQLDVLLDVIEEKEKEARDNTSRLQLQLRKEIESECCVQIQSEVLHRHTQKFLKLCPPPVEEKKTHKLKENVKPTFALEVIPEESSSSNGMPKVNEKGDSCPPKPRMSSSPAEQNSFKSKSIGSGDTTRKKTDSEAARRKSDQRFIERNIKLVTDSHKVGKSAITEEERKHLDKLLENLTSAEIDEQLEKSRSSGDADKPEGFVISTQTRESLEGIDSKLQELSAERNPMQDNNPFYLKEEDQERGWKELQMKQRLKEIDQSLTAISETSSQVIAPVDEHQIKQLLRVCRGSPSCTSLTTGDSASTYDGSCVSSVSALHSLDHPNTPEEVRADSPELYEIENIINSETLTKLLEETKNQMPGFLYRHTQYAGNEEIEEEKEEDANKVEE